MIISAVNSRITTDGNRHFDISGASSLKAAICVSFYASLTVSYLEKKSNY